MTNEKIIKSIIDDTGITKAELFERCKTLGISITQYRENLDRAIAARLRDDPDYLKKRDRIKKYGSVWIRNNDTHKES